jgi:hypothetical protein
MRIKGSADRRAASSCPILPRNGACGPISIGIVGVPSEYDPLDALADIVENAERIETYLAGMDRQAFERAGKPVTLSSAVWSASARPHIDWARARSSLCPTNLGPTSVGWATGCGTLMTAWTWISSGTLLGTVCLALQQMRGGHLQIWEDHRSSKLPQPHAPPFVAKSVKSPAKRPYRISLGTPN